LQDNMALYGGAVAIWGNASVTVVGNCILANISALHNSAGFDLSANSSAALLGITLVNNTAQDNGAGVSAGDTSQVRCWRHHVMPASDWL
jgi:hypothetical protein